MPKRKRTILLTGAGGAGTIYIIRSLIKKYRIITVDMNRYAAGLYLADKGYLLPSCTDRDYLKKLDEIVKKEKVDVIIPLIDEELLAIKRYYKDKLKPKVLLPNENFIKLCLNKWKLMNALAKAKIPCPKTYLLKSFKKLSPNLFPYIIKPIKSRGSRGFQYLNNKDDFKKYFQSNSYKKKDLIIQEVVKGAEFTVSVVVSEQGEVLSVVPKEVILKKGITKIAITRRNPKINKVCQKIQQNFQANGPFNIQLIVDKKTNLPKIFEINPRFSTTVALTIAAGVNEVHLLIECLFNKRVSRPRFKENLVMIRYEDQIYLNRNNIIKNG
jgi:carbamoyl-phosphate synthase large subunit